MEKIVIIQGRVDNIEITQKIINFINSWEIDRLVVSCWQGDSNAQQLKNIDHLYTLTDPGPGPFNGRTPVEQHCNLFRQIVGVKSILKDLSDNSLIFKIRNDCLPTKNVFSFFKNEKGNIFDKKIICGSMMTIDPFTSYELSPCFRVSDWFQLGMKNDLLKLYDVLDILYTTDYSTSYFGTEQIWATAILKKYTNFSAINSLDEYKKEALLYILNNFIILDTLSTMGIKNLGKWSLQPEYLPCYLSEKKYNEYMRNVL